MLDTIFALAIVLATAALAGADISIASTSQSHAKVLRPSSGVGKLTVMAQSQNYSRVIVMLKGLEAGPEWAERIAAARARVMHALAGHHVEINRVYDLTPALALTVDGEALRILRAHPDVAGVAEDGTSSPATGTQPVR